MDDEIRALTIQYPYCLDADNTRILDFVSERLRNDPDVLALLNQGII